MKKLTFLALGLCMAALFSCGKDDSDTPGGGSQTRMAKISAVWIEYSGYREESTDGGNSWHVIGSEYQDKYKKESWSWDGNRLSCITEHYSSGGGYDYNFLYNEDGRISEIINGDRKCEVEYDGNRISRIDYFYNGKSDGYKNFTYSNNKITKMEGEDVESILEEFEWSGDNLTKLIGFYDDEVDYTYRFQSYDNGNNPYYGKNCILLYYFCGFEPFILSANNCTSSNIDGDLVTYEYSYNSKNYPTVVVETVIGEPYEHYGTLRRWKGITTYTYEYVE